MSALLVRRALVLVVVATVSGVLAYAVHGRRGDASPAPAVAQLPSADAQTPRATGPGFEQFALCMRRYGVTLRGDRPDLEGGDFPAAFLACRRYLSAKPFGRDHDFRAE